MPKIAVLNVKGEKVKDIKLNDKVWSIEPNDTVVYEAIVLANAANRQGTHSVKTRAEVSGGGRKPWRQKGTGNARQGSTRSPQWRHGGVVFGPTTERNYNIKMNKKERRLALKSALSYKVIDSELTDEVILASRNVKGVKVILPNEINVLDVTSYHNMIVTEGAVKAIEEVLC